MSGAKEIAAPLTVDAVRELRAGDEVRLTGVIYAARDAAHKRLVEALDRGDPLPFDLAGQVVYYMGPSPAKPGRPIGAAGPTTSGRMDVHTPRLLAEGLRGMIGKGYRTAAVKEAMQRHGAVYFGATGGAGALISRSVRSAEVVAYPELGPEAIWRLEVEGFGLVVINDAYGGDLYEQGQRQYRRPPL